jgi:hypothetical protein
MDKFWNCALVAVACYITYSISFSNNALAGLCGTTYCETEGCYGGYTWTRYHTCCNGTICPTTHNSDVFGNACTLATVSPGQSISTCNQVSGTLIPGDRYWADCDANGDCTVGGIQYGVSIPPCESPDDIIGTCPE